MSCSPSYTTVFYAVLVLVTGNTVKLEYHGHQKEANIS